MQDAFYYDETMNFRPDDKCLDPRNWYGNADLRIQVTVVKKYADIIYRLSGGYVDKIKNVLEDIASEYVPAATYFALFDSIPPKLDDCY